MRYLEKKKINLIFCIILFAGILVRLPGIGDAVYATEYDFTNTLYFSDYEGPHTYVHPPFAISLYTASSYLFPGSAAAYRIIPLIFWIISSYMVFLIAKRFFNSRTAIFSSFFMAFLYPIVNHSLRIDYLMMQISSLLIVAFYILKYYSEKKDRNLYFAGIAIACSVLINYSSFFFVLVITFYFLYKEQNIMNTLKILIKTGIPAFALFILFPIISFILVPTLFLRTISQANKFSFIPNPLTLVYLFVFIGPLLVVLFLSSFSKKKFKKYPLFFIWSLFLLAVLFFTKWYAMVDRYIILLSTELILIGSYLLSLIKFSKKDLTTFIVSSTELSSRTTILKF